MIEEPLVSVGIPCYNRPEGLRRTLECICGQTYRNLEIIISDNCSPDPEVERVCQEFSNKDFRIRYFRQSINQGPMFNFKFVLDKAAGKYFMWAADDDFWDASYVKKLMSLLINSDCGFAYSNMVTVDKFDNVIREYESFSKFTSKNQYENIFHYVIEPEFFGKQNLFYSIFKKEILEYVLNILLDNDIISFNKPGYRPYFDCTLILGVLARSKLCVCEEILRKKRCPPGHPGKKDKPICIKVDYSKPYNYPLPENCMSIIESDYETVVRETDYYNFVKEILKVKKVYNKNSSGNAILKKIMLAKSRLFKKFL